MSTERLQTFVKGSNGIRILPYVEVNGMRTASDDFMKRLFVDMVNEGSLQAVFYQGEVRTPDEFLVFIKEPRNHPIVLFYEEQPAAVAWLNGLGANHGFCHHWFYKRVWGQKSLEIARTALDYWFSFPREDGSPLLDVLVGMTPAWNRRAVKFAEKTGFKILGEIPKIAGGSAAVISYLEREAHESSRLH